MVGEVALGAVRRSGRAARPAGSAARQDAPHGPVMGGGRVGASGLGRRMPSARAGRLRESATRVVGFSVSARCRQGGQGDPGLLLADLGEMQVDHGRL